MNFFSAMKSLNNLESKICVIPCKIKNRIFYHESSITQEYNIKRSYSLPRLKYQLKINELKENQRAVLNLEVFKSNNSPLEMINGVILFDVNKSELDTFIQREKGYKLCFIQKKDIEFVYQKWNKDFLIQLQNQNNAVIHKIIKKYRKKLIKDLIKKKKLYDILKILKKIEIEDIIDDKFIEKEIKRIFPDEIFIFASIPNQHQENLRFLIKEILSFSKKNEFLKTKDPQTNVFELINNWEKNLDLDNQEIIFNNYKMKFQDNDGNPLDFTFILENFKPNSQLSLEKYLKFDDILKEANSKNKIKLICGGILSFININYTTQPFYECFTKDFHINLLPIIKYHKNIIMKPIYEQWGEVFVRDFTKTTYLADNRSIDQIVQYIPDNFLNTTQKLTDLFTLKFHDFRWFFVFKTGKLELSPKSIAEKLLNKKLIMSILCPDDQGNEIKKFMKKTKMFDSWLYNNLSSNKFRLFNDIFNPSIINHDVYAICVLGKFKFKIHYTNFDVEDIETEFFIDFVIYNSGNINFQIRIPDFENIIDKIGIEKFYSWWSTKLTYNIDITILSEENNSKILKYLKSSEIFHSITEIIKKICEVFSHIIKPGKNKLSYKATMNHPLLFASFSKNDFEKIKNKIDFSDGYQLIQEYPSLEKYLFKPFNYKKSTIAKIPNISPYENCLIYSNFQTLIIFPSENAIFNNPDEINRISCIFDFLFASRYTFISIHNELKNFTLKSSNHNKIDIFNKLIKLWIRYTLQSNSSRIFKDKVEMRFQNYWYKSWELIPIIEETEKIKKEIEYVQENDENKKKSIALILINIILAGSLASDILLNVFSMSPLEKILRFFSIWGILAITVFLSFRFIPYLILRLKSFFSNHRTF
ncbi:MAG: hypothetical protein ACTSXK_11080 [Promethearchaeota archaeon]